MAEGRNGYKDQILEGVGGKNNNKKQAKCTYLSGWQEAVQPKPTSQTNTNF